MAFEALETLLGGNHLSRAESRAVFADIVKGELTEIEITALLIALRCRGETPNEIAGAAEAMRAAATPFPRPDYPFADSCGTGGDGARTVNISTAAAVVAAEAGLPVAKHGNRSISSSCGSADVLERLGVELEAPPEVARRCLDEVGLCFLFAPRYHAGVRFAMPVRKSLATRTVFNVTGPLSNPAAPSFQLLGVYEPSLCRPMAETLRLLGTRAALVVHGSGVDEIAIHGPTEAVWLHDGELESLAIAPEELGLPRYGLDRLAGGDSVANGRWLTQLLAGQGSDAHNAAVAINAGALLWVSGRAPSLRAGVDGARETLANGGGLTRLERWAELSRGA